MDRRRTRQPVDESGDLLEFLCAAHPACTDSSATTGMIRGNVAGFWVAVPGTWAVPSLEPAPAGLVIGAHFWTRRRQPI
jgi:uncharacterized protein involved in response to NO